MEEGTPSRPRRRPAARLRFRPPEVLTWTLLAALLTSAAEGSAQATCPARAGAETEAGWTAYRNNDMESARARFEAALALCPDNAYARTGLGYVELREGELPEARRAFQMAVEAEPASVDALVGLGLVAWREGNVDEAEARFRGVLALVPDHPTAQEYVDRIEGARAATAPDSADAAWARGDVSAAVARYLERLREDPEDDVALLRLGLAAAWDGRFEDALAYLERLLSAQPRNVDAALARARVLAWSGALDAARAATEEVLRLDPANVDALFAAVQFRAWAEANRDVEGVAEDLDAIGLAGGGGEAAPGARDVASRALSVLDSVLAVEPDHRSARLARGRILALQGRYDAALEDYGSVLRAHPGDEEAELARAQTLAWAGRLGEAETELRRLSASPTAAPEAYQILGLVLRWQDRLREARTALLEAARLRPGDPDTRDQLRRIESALAPRVASAWTVEDDSDGNRMHTQTVGLRWRGVDRVDLRAGFRRRGLSQPLALGTLAREAWHAEVAARYAFDGGWSVEGAAGFGTTDGSDGASAPVLRIALGTPDRGPLALRLIHARGLLDETASLAERGIHSAETVLAGRWMPGPGWRLDAAVGVGRYQGAISNGRRSALVGVSRTVRYGLTVGTAARAFSFQKNVNEGYFDPDFYGIVELTAVWERGLGSWSARLEAAPGIQQVTTDGTPELTLRFGGRVSYALGEGRELFASGMFSNAGLTARTARVDGYRYARLRSGVRWTVR